MREESELKALRPEVFTEETTNELESFQNQVLRPLLKYQHNLIIQLTKKEKLFQKQISEVVKIQQKRMLIKQFFLTQPNFKYFLIGQICGLMTESELDFYLQNKKEFDKRISGMLAERILSCYL
jgi:predicted XRE-type DNA-binding protein